MSTLTRHLCHVHWTSIKQNPYMLSSHITHWVSGWVSLGYGHGLTGRHLRYWFYFIRNKANGQMEAERSIAAAAIRYLIATLDDSGKPSYWLNYRCQYQQHNICIFFCCWKNITFLDSRIWKMQLTLISKLSVGSRLSVQMAISMKFIPRILFLSTPIFRT